MGRNSEERTRKLLSGCNFGYEQRAHIYIQNPSQNNNYSQIMQFIIWVRKLF